MSLHPSLVNHLQEHFTTFFRENVQVRSSAPVAGSAISQTFLLETSMGPFFMKLNSALFGLDFFEKEAKGLDLLANAGALKVARPLFDGRFHQQIYVVMEYLEKGEPDPDFWEDFGRRMAALHRNTQAQFGLSYNNYIGKIPQRNTLHDTWPSFFADERIMRLADRAHTHGLLDAAHADQAGRICARLPDLLPEEEPALLHGDLWNGNFMVHTNGKVALFDPATYYGNREMDIAMSRLFGGFDNRFYGAYHEAWELQPGYAEREPLLQLYPLLVHLLLFGGHYRDEVIGILRRFS
jgi:fructosamine-3-kinase